VNPLATPPLEHDSLLPLLPLQNITSHLNASIKEVIHDVSHSKNPLLRTPSRNSSPTSRREHLNPSKGGDAIGQPRKSPVRSITQPSELRQPEPAGSLRMEKLSQNSGNVGDIIVARTTTTMRNRSSPPPSPISPMDGAFPDSTRGTKRGLTRRPLIHSSPNYVTPSSPSAFPTFKVHTALQRSTSIVSMASVSSIERDERPSKRRTGQSSPLMQTGLSSPPPSRRSSPAIDDVLKEERDVIVPLPTRLPSKLQRLRPLGVVQAERSNSVPTGKAAKSSMPIRTIVPPTAAKEIKYHHSAHTPPRTKTGQKESDVSATRLPVPVKRESRRMMLTPPTFAMGMLAKMTGTSPSGRSASALAFVKDSCALFPLVSRQSRKD